MCLPVVRGLLILLLIAARYVADCCQQLTELHVALGVPTELHLALDSILLGR